MRDRSFILLGVLLFGTVATSAQTTDQTPPADQTETIKALVQEVQELKSRIAALEAKQALEEATPTPTPPAQTPPVNPPSAEPPTLSQPGVFETLPGIKFQGFGSVTSKDINFAPAQT